MQLSNGRFGSIPAFRCVAGFSAEHPAKLGQLAGFGQSRTFTKHKTAGLIDNFMSTNRFLSIEAARCAGHPKGSRWAVLFGPREQYLGRIFLTAPQQFLLVTRHGDLAFNSDEVLGVEWVDNALVTDTERSYWPSDPFI